MVTKSEQDKKIDKVLESIKDGYDKLEKIELELEANKKKRDTIFKSND